VRFVGTLVTTSAPLLVGSHTTPSRLCNRGPAVVADWVTGEQVESVSQADPPIACNLIGPRRTSEPTPHWPTCGFFGGGSRRLTRKRRKRQPQDSTRGVSADHSAFCCRRNSAFTDHEFPIQGPPVDDLRSGPAQSCRRHGRRQRHNERTVRRGEGPLLLSEAILRPTPSGRLLAGPTAVTTNRVCVRRQCAQLSCPIGQQQLAKMLRVACRHRCAPLCRGPHARRWAVSSIRYGLLCHLHRRHSTGPTPGPRVVLYTAYRRTWLTYAAVWEGGRPWPPPRPPGQRVHHTRVVALPRVAPPSPFLLAVVQWHSLVPASANKQGKTSSCGTPAGGCTHTWSVALLVAGSGRSTWNAWNRLGREHSGLRCLFFRFLLHGALFAITCLLAV